MDQLPLIDVGQPAKPPDQPEEKGLVCRKCGSHKFSVIYTRPKIGTIMRLRKCMDCGKKYPTYEQM